MKGRKENSKKTYFWKINLNTEKYVQIGGTNDTEKKKNKTTQQWQRTVASVSKAIFKW